MRVAIGREQYIIGAHGAGHANRNRLLAERPAVSAEPPRALQSDGFGITGIGATIELLSTIGAITTLASTRAPERTILAGGQRSARQSVFGNRYQRSNATDRDAPVEPLGQIGVHL